MRLAVVADWLVTYGGAEHVLAEIARMYPDAPFFTTVARPDKLGPLKSRTIHTTYLQKLYRILGNHQILLPLMPRAIESIDLTGFDVVLSSSHAVGKGVIPPPSALHICYCHTPMRYAWEMEEEYLRDFGVPGFLRGTVKKLLARLRTWDLSTAKRVDLFIANSTTTQERIKRIYGRESIVIPPPVDDRFFAAISGQRSADASSEHDPLPATRSSYFLAVGRMVPYKRFDLLIRVANELGLPLKIAGTGQDEARLRALAGPTVEFLGFVPEADLPELYAHARALFFPQYEDAGIVLLEAQASGTPAIAFRAGGATDALVENVTGVFFDEQTDASLRDAVRRFSELKWDREAIRRQAARFSQTAFTKRLRTEIESACDAFRNGRFTRP